VEILGHTIVKRRGGCLFSAGDRVAFGLRPEQLKLSLLEPKDFENGIRGVIEKQIFMGDLTRFLIRVADGSLVDVSIANYLMFEGEVMPYELREEVFVVWSQGSGIILHA
jgi:putrescine transport system ATP-binding protein